MTRVRIPAAAFLAMLGSQDFKRLFPSASNHLILTMMKSAKGAKAAAFGALAAFLMNSCHEQKTFTISYDPNKNSPYTGEWRGTYFIYGYPSRDSRHRGRLDVRIRSNRFLSGKIFYKGMAGELNGWVNDDGRFFSGVEFNYKPFIKLDGDLSGGIEPGKYSSGNFSTDMIKGEFALSINGDSYKGNLALLPSASSDKQIKDLEKLLASTSSTLQ